MYRSQACVPSKKTQNRIFIFKRVFYYGRLCVMESWLRTCKSFVWSYLELKSRYINANVEVESV